MEVIMKTISIIIILDGISTAFRRNPNENLNVINLIIGLIVICIGISVFSKRKFSYYSVITIYILKIISMIYFTFDLIIEEGFEFAPLLFIGITTTIYIGIIVYFKNRKMEFR
jgi:hypothetical protein